MPFTIHYANVGSETVWQKREAPSFTLPKVVQEMRRDLASLPLWTTPQEDRTLLATPFSADHLQAFHPSFKKRLCTLQEAEKLLSRHEADLSVWAPERIAALHAWGALPSDVRPNSPIDRAIGRQLSARFFERYAHNVSQEVATWLITSESQLETLLSTETSLIFKHPYSSSGRGVAHWQKGSPHRFALQGLSKYGFILVERKMPKVADYAAEYYITPRQEVLFRGISVFETDPLGHYVGNQMLGKSKAFDALTQIIGADKWQDTLSSHMRCLTEEVAPYYTGWIGIDMLTFHSATLREIDLHPFVEINLRYTMGAYALDLYDAICPPESHASLRIIKLSNSGATSCQKPLTQEPIFSPFDSGSYLLTPITPQSQYGAILKID